MLPLSEWLPLVVIGVTFTLLGSFKLYGFLHGIEGGHSKPLIQQLCGT